MKKRKGLIILFIVIAIAVAGMIAAAVLHHEKPVDYSQSGDRD